MSQFPKLAVVTIEGGGVYGFNLLGQLQAANDAKIIPVAMAGTSAGAIIATLHWAGYSPAAIREKFCELADTNQLVNVLEPFDNIEGERFTYASFRSLCGKVSGILGNLVPLAKIDWVALKPWHWFRMGHLFRIPKAELIAHANNRGLFKGDRLADYMENWLRNSPLLSEGERNQLEQRRPRPQMVTFGDFVEIKKASPLPPLFLPVTNVTRRQLEVVCSIDPHYASWQIARAVRASAGYPGFFRPTRFGNYPEESEYVDGGVIANYPCWVFGHEFREKLYSLETGKEFAVRPWLHLGLCFGPPSSQTLTSDRTSRAFFVGMFRLMIGGARRQLEGKISQLISRTIEVRQPEDETDAPADLLDLASCNRDRINAMFKRGLQAGKECLDRVAFELPDQEKVNPILQGLIAKAACCLGSGENLIIRSNVFLPTTDPDESWRIEYSAGMDGDPDQKLALPKFAGLTGMCAGLRRPLICNLAEVLDAAEKNVDTGRLFGMPPATHQSVREDRTWLASVPIFDCFAQYPDRLGSDLSQYHGRFQPFQLVNDGAILGVLNLDANLNYDHLGLDPNPEVHWTDVRVQSIIAVMRSVATELSTLLSIAFGASRR